MANEGDDNQDLVDERAALQLELEIAKLRADIRDVGRRLPWWRDGAWITSITAIVGVVVTILTFGRDSLEKAHDLKLRELKQNEDIRTAYLERMDTPGEHLRTLRFVIATSEDPDLKAWAIEENKVAQKEFDDENHKLAVADAEERAALDDWVQAIAGEAQNFSAEEAAGKAYHALHEKKEKVAEAVHGLKKAKKPTKKRTLFDDDDDDE